jgi:hypothetical protein
MRRPRASSPSPVSSISGFLSPKYEAPPSSLAAMIHRPVLTSAVVLLVGLVWFFLMLEVREQVSYEERPLVAVGVLSAAAISAVSTSALVFAALRFHLLVLRTTALSLATLLAFVLANIVFIGVTAYEPTSAGQYFDVGDFVHSQVEALCTLEGIRTMTGYAIGGCTLLIMCICHNRFWRQDWGVTLRHLIGDDPGWLETVAIRTRNERHQGYAYREVRSQ